LRKHVRRRARLLTTRGYISREREDIIIDHIELEGTVGLQAPKRNKSISGIMFLAAILVATGDFCARGEPGRPRTLDVVPLPPPRPADFDGARVPDQPRAVPPSTSPATQANDDAAILRPRTLPTASREQMHACAVEWREMKKSGAAGDKTWRDFAQSCLSR